MTLLALSFVLLLPLARLASHQGTAAPLSRAEMEQLLSKGSIGNEREIAHATRVTLNDGNRQHEAILFSPERNDEGNIYLNVAAYELDKVLGLGMVVPAVERTVKGQTVVLVWWVDDVAMMEIDRRRRNVQPPDPENWDRQMQAVRLFDELISNPWRSMNPATSSWQELLITGNWTIHLIDHRRAFRFNRQLENPETLTRCDRKILAASRALNREILQRTLGNYISREQLDALEDRLQLLVKHFNSQIAARGASAVLYDLPLTAR